MSLDAVVRSGRRGAVTPPLAGNSILAAKRRAGESPITPPATSQRAHVPGTLFVLKEE